MSDADRYPVEGMTKIPAFTEDCPIMKGCFMACAMATLNQPGALEAFQKDSGFDLARLLKRSPIERMIDDCTGYDKTVLAAYFDWVAETVWGIAGRDEDLPDDEGDPRTPSFDVGLSK